MDVNQEYNNPSPETKASFISKLFFCWLMPFVRLGYKKEVQLKDIYDISEKDKSQNLGNLLESNWNEELENSNNRKGNPSLLRVIAKTFGISYMKLGIWLYIQFFLIRCSQPYVLGEYIRFFQNGSTKTEFGWILGFGVIMLHCLVVLIYHHYFTYSQLLGLKVKVACSSLIYRKILKLSQASLNQTATGEVVNLISNDLQRMEKCVSYLHHIYVVPLQIVMMSYLLVDVGISYIPGLLFTIIVGFLLQGYLSKLQEKLRSDVACLSGKRLALINDIISGIQVIKMYVWEDSFEERVKTARKLELGAIAISSFLKGITVAAMVVIERLSIFLVITCYCILLDNRLTADAVFTLACVFNYIETSVCYYLPQSLESIAETKVSIERLQKFLLLEEVVHLVTTTATGPPGTVELINVAGGLVTTTPTLFDISLNITPGTLCCVLGKVGVGKTTLLHMLLQELPPTAGELYINGKISYAPQDPWLFIASVRNNILFGQDFIPDKYQKVVDACALVADFQQFPYRDQSIIGERGVSLSGGQRARVNLARAVYQDADIYLLDDPLSAVDVHVAKHLFEECILKYLQSKTRILVTHQIQFLKQSDLIVVLEEGRIGKILRSDEMSESVFNKLNQVMPDNEKNGENGSDIGLVKRSNSNISQSSETEYEKQTENEEIMSRNVSFISYLKYFSSGTNLCVLILILICFLITQTCLNASDMAITYWIDYEERKYNIELLKHNSNETDMYLLPERGMHANSTKNDLRNTSSIYYYTQINEENAKSSDTTYFYFYIYMGTVFGGVVFATLRSILFCKACINSSSALHKKILKSILQAPLRFFQTNPSGRIMTRFSKDIGTVDETLPIDMLWSFQLYLDILGCLIVTCYMIPWAAIVLIVILSTIPYSVVAVFLPTLLKIIKIEANNRSPILSHISTTMYGLPTIRSAKAEEMVRKNFDSLQDVHTSSRYMMIVYSKMFGLYLDVAGIILLAIFTLNFLIFRNENTQSGDIGLVLNKVTTIAGLLEYGITKSTEVLSSMVSVERILQYTNIEKEVSTESTNREDLMKPWPQLFGSITFSNVCLTYVPEEPPVLKHINISIAAGERVGIVGRTGAGKSSLITCLFRLTPVEGTIIIDDIDTATVDLKTLRSHISIIPQEPVLFFGSLRYNIDPLGTASDETLWRILENVKLSEAVANLDQEIGSRGSNFSTGQKQLICMARAIVKNNKMLVMDEATAHVDPVTDELIQKSIRENFRNCTVLTIAHRLNTIMDSDRVLVMSSGQAVEFAHAHVLLQKPNGYLATMLQETGRIMEEDLRKIAKEDFNKKYLNVS